MIKVDVGVQKLIIAFLLAVGIALGGYRAHALSRSGAIAAVLVGGITFGFGGWLNAILLIAFFVSSSVLSRVGGRRKQEVSVVFAKGGKRDYGQVFANGGLAALFAALYGISGQVAWLVGTAGALAAVNADTWSTELGVLARGWPRMITNGSRVEPGTSGAITLEGTLAALGGAIAIGFIFLVGTGELLAGAVVTLAGFMGSIVDSLLGASVQAIYHCESCNKLTERHPSHTCGTTTNHARGWRWLSNDMVNFAASFVGSFMAILIWWLVRSMTGGFHPRI